ncbi:unnamed protein product [Arabidopsis halleri]
MVFAWCGSASKFAFVCGQVRSISTVVNRSNLARNSSPLQFLVSRGFLHSTAIDRQSSNQMLLRLIDSEIYSALQFHDLDFDDEPTPGINPYTIEDNGGKTVTLTRDYQGEHIIVVAGMPYEEDDGLRFPLTERFTKKISGLRLKFRCTAIDHGTSMDDVSVINRGNYWEDQRACDLLNKEYRHCYMCTIFDYSAKFSLYNYMTTDTRKYVLWLKDVKKFLEE